MAKNTVMEGKTGDSITCGQELGKIGSSGMSTTPHVHVGYWESQNQNTQIDPYAGECSTLDNYTKWVSYWTEQGKYKELPGASCYQCEVEPGRYAGQKYSDNRIAFQQAYGYTHYLRNDELPLKPGDKEPRLGCPTDNGGSAFVHEVYGVALQDFSQLDPTLRFKSSDDGSTALAYHSGLKKALLLRGGFWGAYKCIDATVGGSLDAMGGAKWLGAPKNNEYVKDGASYQDFEHGFMYFDGKVHVHFDESSGLDKEMEQELAVAHCGQWLDVVKNWPEGAVCDVEPETCNNEDDDGNGIVDDGCPEPDPGVFRLVYSAPGCADSLGVMGEVHDANGKLVKDFWPPNMMCGHEFTNAITCDIQLDPDDGGTVLGNVALALAGDLHWACEKTNDKLGWYGQVYGLWQDATVFPEIASNGFDGCNFTFDLAGGVGPCPPECNPGNFGCASETAELDCYAPSDTTPCWHWGNPIPCGNGKVCISGQGCEPCGYVNEPCCENKTCLNKGLCNNSVCGPGCVPSGEVCNGVDDDCDTQVDEGDPGSGASCNTGLPGICGNGVVHCVNAALSCVQQVQSQTETCNGLDDNCDGQTDEGCMTGNWSLEYTPDTTVIAVQKIEGWATGFTQVQFPCTSSAGTWTCTLPSNPGAQLQVWATVMLQGNQPGWSCTATAPCQYQLRGTFNLVDPNNVKAPLGTAWNNSSQDHCYACNATFGFTVACNPAKPQCIP
jgi:hypothetical protein